MKTTMKTWSREETRWSTLHGGEMESIESENLIRIRKTFLRTGKNNNNKRVRETGVWWCVCGKTLQHTQIISLNFFLALWGLQFFLRPRLRYMGFAD